MTTEITTWSAADAAHQRGTQAYIEFSHECAKLVADGMIQEAIGARYSMSQSAVAQCLAVGKDTRFASLEGKLPRAMRVLYELTTLNDEGFYEMATPEATCASVLAYKRRLAPPKVEPEHVEPDLEDPAVKARLAEITRQAELDASRKVPRAKGKEPKAEPEAPIKELPAPVDDSKLIATAPHKFLGDLVAELLEMNDAQTVKAVKTLLSKAYHPDTSRIRPDGVLLAKINQCFSNIDLLAPY